MLGTTKSGESTYLHPTECFALPFTCSTLNLKDSNLGWMGPLRNCLFVWVLLVTFIWQGHVSRVQAEGGVERETIEMLFKVLSPECRDEMDAALVHPDADMSDECKKEIEKNLEQLQYSKDTVDEAQGQHSDTGDANGGNMKSKTGVKGEKSFFSSSSTSREDAAANAVMMYVIGFLTFIFASAGVYIYIVNANAPKENYRSPKKLSKQKQEKQRQRGMR